jgi:hypothetical protein
MHPKIFVMKCNSLGAVSLSLHCFESSAGCCLLSVQFDLHILTFLAFLVLTLTLLAETLGLAVGRKASIERVPSTHQRYYD